MRKVGPVRWSLLAMLALSVVGPAAASPAYPAGTRFTGRLTLSYFPEWALGDGARLPAVLTEVTALGNTVYVYCEAELGGRRVGQRLYLRMTTMDCPGSTGYRTGLDAVVLDADDQREGLALELRGGVLQVPWG